MSTLDQIINGGQGNAKIIGRFFDGQEIMHGRKSPISGEMGKTFRKL